MTFTQSVSSGFRRYFDFRTRSSRSEYWWWVLFFVLASIAATILDEILFSGTEILDSVNTIVMLIPWLAVAVRRLHDIDRSGWWFLIAFTIIGIFLLIYWYIQPGTIGANRFGQDPLRAGLGAELAVDFDGTGQVFDASSQSGFCANCGTALDSNANFCRSCGTAI